jgi:hypothetical protein
LQWILFFFIPNNLIDDTRFNFEAYKELSGQILCRLKVEDVERIDGEYGKSVYYQFLQFNTPSECKSKTFVLIRGFKL